MAEIRITADTNQAERAINALTGALGALSAVLIGGNVVEQFVKLTAAAQEMTNKLIFATGSVQGANVAFDLLAQTARSTGSSLGGTIDLFQKLSMSSTLAGSSQESLALITSNFNKTLQISGASGAGAAAALYQFAQAMQKGSLNGDEFRTISETNGYLLKVLETQTGKTATELRQMASDGKLSAEIIARALTEADQITKDYGKTVQTIPQAFENLNTSLTVAVKNFNDVTGFGNMLVKILNLMADNIGVVIGGIAGLAVGIGALLITLIPAATAMAVLTGGAAVAGAIAMGAALGLTAQQMGLFGKESDKAAKSQQQLTAEAAKGLKITHMRNQQALDLDKALVEQIGKLKGENAALEKGTGIRNLQLEVEKALSEERNKYKKTGEAIPAQLEKELAIELRRKILAGEKQKIDQELLKIRSASASLNIQDVAQAKLQNDLESIRLTVTKETWNARKGQLEAAIKQNIADEASKNLREETKRLTNEISLLTIADVRQREIEAAILLKRNELGSAFTKQMEDQYRVTLQTLQANRLIDELRQKNINQLKNLGVQPEIDALKLYRSQDKTGGQGYGERLNKGNLDRAIRAEIGQTNKLMGIQNDYSKKIADLKNIQTQLKIEGLDKEFAYEQQITAAITQLNLEANYAIDQLRAQQFQNFSKYEDMKVQRAAETHAEQMRLQKDLFGNQMFNSEQIKQIAVDRANFEKQTELQKSQFVLEQGSQIFSALGAQNKKAFEAAKAFNIANAIMNTYMGATKALATYPWPFGLIAAAAAVAAGMAQVSAIRSQSYSGRALGGPVMGGQSYIVGESGPELFTPSTTGNITRNQDLGGQAVTVNFNIQANDSQGFDELLSQRRGMITQMISDAMLERGNRSMI